LFRRTRSARWQDVGLVIAARDIDRGSPAAEALDAPETAYDGVYVMDSARRRILAVSSRFFRPRAQEMTLRRAPDAGARIAPIDGLTRRQVREQAPPALRFVDRRPILLVAALLLVYIGHNLRTFVVWGL